jgi:Flp pilus assembly protein CpaB
MELTGKRYGRTDWRKLLGSRRGTVIVAVLCTIAAAGVLVFAMNRYRNSVNASGAPERVFVATQSIPKNTPGDVIATDRMFRTAQIATKQVAAGAIADAAFLHGEVAVRDIYAGEQLTAADFTANGGLPAQLAPTDRAITLTLDQEHGMLGLLHDGDHVDVYAGVAVTSTGGQAVPELRLLIANVPVLKAGADNGSSGLGSSNSSNTSPVTLKVPASAAGAVALAADDGKVWLVLRPANAKPAAGPSLITIQSLLLGSRPATYGGGK